MADSSVGDIYGLSRFACTECKARKVKCDRTKPACRRCAQYGDDCRYPTTRLRPPPRSGRPKLNELQERLVELEAKLQEKQTGAKSDGMPATPESMPETYSLVSTGRTEQLPSHATIEELTNTYFVHFHDYAPMLHPGRYPASLHKPSHMQPPMCLQYIVMALAASVLPNYKELQEPYYIRARKYLEMDEMKEEGHNITLAHAQCWCLISYYEVQQMYFSRASVSASRAVRLSQILGLQCLDGTPRGAQTLPAPRDWCEKEERRRTLWTIFCCDRGSSSATGWPTLMDVGEIQTMLPVSEEAYYNGIEEPSIKLRQALDLGSPKSTLGCRVVAMYLFQKCFDSGQDDTWQPSPDPSQSFWARFQELNAQASRALSSLPDHLQYFSNFRDGDAAVVNLKLHTSIICLYKAASGRARQEAEKTAVRDIDAAVLYSAQHVANIIATMANIDLRFRYHFVAYGAFMAAFVFMKDHLRTGNPHSLNQLCALQNVMIAIAADNALTASLAVQVAQQMTRSGIDPQGMQKVESLLAKLDLKGPILGQEEQESSDTLRKHPLETRFGSLDDSM